HFIAETLSKVSPVPVVHIAMPMHFREPPALTAGELVWPDAFTFLFSWDYNSVFARKNPLAVVKAYTDAFAEQDGTALVLKCINPVAEPVGHRLVQDAIAGRSDIVLIDSYLDPADKDRLMRSCDAYVSLHRSEGLGLTMAEAMFHGKPVIATGYSGNTDFMDGTNSFLVDYALTPIGRDAGPYPADGEWAEPDVAHATRLLRHVLNNPEDAAARAAKAAADIRERHSLAAAGAAMSRRLEHVAGRVPPSATAPREAPEIVEVQRLLDRGGRPDRRSRFGKVGGAARRTVLRTIRPYTAYQHQVNGALAQALGAVDDAVTTADARAHADVTQAQAAAMAQTRRQQVQIDDHAVAFSRVDVHLASLQAEFERHRAEIDALQAALRSTEERLAATRVEHGGRLDAAEHLTHELRELPYVTGEPFATFDAGTAGEVLGFREGDRRVASGDEAYRAFEDVFRGSENMIADRQRCYLDILERASASPAVDVGCGRGEFLDLLAEAGIDAIGVDQDPGMVARCRDKGHGQTVEGDGIAYLETRDDASLGLIFSAQVAEHLAPEALLGLLSVAARKLRPEGLLVLETVNPHSVAALKAFWVDITHRHPLFPEALLVLARTAGFGSAYVFHPNGTGAVEADRHNCGEYALVARRA
ncbi:MAG: glycosyltransferase, partial [Solirubrobacterales bacterium]|nr:glycosyltransferase [Solirubrobacterales bacterium]